MMSKLWQHIKSDFNMYLCVQEIKLKKKKMHKARLRIIRLFTRPINDKNKLKIKKKKKV